MSLIRKLSIRFKVSATLLLVFAVIFPLTMIGASSDFVTDALADKVSGEWATVKGLEIASLGSIPKEKVSSESFNGYIEVVGIEPIEKGVAVFARAWDADDEQIGFGPDGTVDIERFIIINPSVLVPNEQGGYADVDVVKSRREEIKEALLQSLMHTISVKKEVFSSQNIVPGKVGNTTTIVYPDADPENTTIDGHAFRASGGETWGAIRAGVGTAFDDSGVNLLARTSSESTTDQYGDLLRAIVLFDTSSIPDGDIIHSATLSLYGTWSDEAHESLGADLSASVYTSAPASTTALASADYSNTGTVPQSDTTITTTTWADGSEGNPAEAYNDFPLNATGRGNVSKTGVSTFALKLTQDSSDSAPTWAPSVRDGVRAYSAEQPGTSQDPKLVIEHAVDPTPVDQFKVRKSADESVVSSAALQADAELSVTVKSGKTYIVEGILFASSTSANPDLRIAFEAPSGSEFDIGHTSAGGSQVDGGVLETSGASSIRVQLPANIPVPVMIRGTVVSGADGTLDLYWAQFASNANNVVIKEGSYLKVEEI